MRWKIRVFHVIISCLVISPASLGQKIQKKVRFKEVAANNQISNSNITAIHQDSRGFLWVGTDDGLNRYDGYDYAIYRNIENDTTSLAKNKIQCIYEDSRGTLWVSTLNSGFHYYNRSLDGFIRVSEFSVPHCQVMRIIEDRQHNIWIGGVLNSQAFIAMHNVSTGKWNTHRLFPTTDPVYSMAQLSEDEFLLGTRLNGLFKWNVSTHSLEHFQHDPGNANSLPGNYIEKILLSPQGHVWIATRSGLCQFNPTTNSYRTFAAGSGGSSLPSNDIMDICLDGRYLWIATENGGLSRMNLESETFDSYVYDKFDPGSIINNSIWSLHRDRQGRIWIGSYAKGLCVLDSRQEKFSTLDIPLDNNLVNAVLKDSKGRFWIGTEEGLLLYENKTITHFRHNPSNKYSLSSNAINCLYEDRRHQIWTGHWNGGINRYDEMSRNFIRYLPDPARSGTLSNPNVFSITESSATGELFVATFGGLHILKDQEAGVFENVNDYPHEGDQLLLTLFEDSKRNMWLGSYSGLGLLDPLNHRIRRFHFKKDSTEINDRVNCIHEDKRNRLWIGSFGGLHQMVDSSTFITYTTKDGLPVNIVQGILEDSHGNLWLGTTHGLVFFNPGTKVFRTYDETDGLVSNEFRRKAFYLAEDGQMFVGGNGLNAFYPDSINIHSTAPPVFLTDLRIFNQSIRPNGADGILKDAIAQTDEIFLDHSRSFISIHYVSLNLTASRKNQYAYWLDGFDTDWNYVGNQRFATFTNLNPGTYTFRVKASNSDGVWNEEATSLVIHILPPWYGTIWFRSLAAGLLLSMAAAFYYVRIGAIKRQNIRLEDLVNRRTQELREMNTELAQSQEETSTQRDQLAEQNHMLAEATRTIENKNLEILQHNETLEKEVERRTKDLLEHNHQLEQFAFISAHNLRSPVARILGLGEVLKHCKTEQEKELILEKLVHTTRELDNVVRDLNQILDVRKNNTAVISEIHLPREMALVRATLEKEIEDTRAGIIEDFTRVTTIRSVKPYVDSILMNLVSNAIKYRSPERDPRIVVAAEASGEHVCLSVRDNGLGINLSKYEDKLFKLYNRFHLHVEGKGMGLYLVKTQVAALGGRIEAMGNPDHGMTFKVYLPAKLEFVL